jgi:hypothetical protein
LERTTFERSTALVFAEYDPATGVLVVGLRSGSVYRYYMVPRAAFRGLQAAPSAGRYFIDNIRDGFRCERLGDEP